MKVPITTVEDGDTWRASVQLKRGRKGKPYELVTKPCRSRDEAYAAGELIAQRWASFNGEPEAFLVKHGVRICQPEAT